MHANMFVCMCASMLRVSNSIKSLIVKCLYIDRERQDRFYFDVS